MGLKANTIRQQGTRKAGWCIVSATRKPRKATLSFYDTQEEASERLFCCGGGDFQICKAIRIGTAFRGSTLPCQKPDELTEWNELISQQENENGTVKN